MASSTVSVTDGLKAQHQLTIYFFHTGVNQVEARAYLKSDDVDIGAPITPDLPRQAGPGVTMAFDGSGARVSPPTVDFSTGAIPWNDNATALPLSVSLSALTQLPAGSSPSLSADGGPATNFDCQAPTPGQTSDGSQLITIYDNIDARAPYLAGGAAGIPVVSSAGAAPNTTTTFSQISTAAAFSVTAEVRDSLNAAKSISIFFFHIGVNQYEARAYISGLEVDSAAAQDNPRLLGPGVIFAFTGGGLRTSTPVAPAVDFSATIPWNGGRAANNVSFRFVPLSQLAGGSFLRVILDRCSLDGTKLDPGRCGCGIPDTDTDGDGTPDCLDSCPHDAAKTEAGMCGCGTADTNADNDSQPDCLESCPNDPVKLAPGVCGCGVSDVDTDGDGTPNCNDACPNEPVKLAPGVCGCGVSDVDTDGDGTPDCLDRCPSDPMKRSPGTCGCGVAESDLNGNGESDCLDPTAQSAPDAPVVTVRQRSATIALQSYPGAVRYELDLKHEGDTLTRRSEFPSVRLRNLAPGRWSVRYTVRAGSGDTQTVSSASPRVLFRIKR